MRNEQNIFDNDTFFEGYKLLRENHLSANNVEEKPALFRLLPELKGKRVLDLGCGYGENCRTFSEMGAAYVLGIDVSEKMLAVAQRENAGPGVEFLQMDMEDIDTLQGEFDVVVSSLALHYILNFDSVVGKIRGLLKDNGYFVFTQEHPITTAPVGGTVWKKSGEYIDGLLLTDYAAEGRREVTWFVDGVVKFHRRTDTVVNTLIDNGFAVTRMLEPTVSEEIISRQKNMSRCRHAPDYLMIRAKKLSPAQMELLK